MLGRGELEQALLADGFQRIAGVDEAGRGPLAGPVVAAACILPPQFDSQDIDDSKRLSPAARRRLFERLRGDHSIDSAIFAVEPPEIDKINILQATLLAMRSAVDALRDLPDYLLIDGSTWLGHSLPGETVVKGDRLCYSIGAASVLAKEYRDQLMLEYHERWPMYGFDRHKGYPTKAHYEALAEHGPCPIHRLSFRGVQPEATLFT